VEEALIEMYLLGLSVRQVEDITEATIGMPGRLRRNQHFQLHAVTREGRAVLRKKVSRGQLLNFLSGQPRAVVAMEACATAHDWGRAIKKLGHEVRLIPPTGPDVEDGTA
jgi:hypothetical protein